MRLLALAAPAALLLATTPAFADTLASGSPSDLLEIDDEWVTGLNQPTAMAFLPDGRMVITLRAGDVLVRNTDGSLDEAGTISVSTSFGEKGLLNVVPHPDYASNHLLFFYYTGQGGGGDDNRVVTMELSDDNALDTGSEVRLLEGIAAPLNHDGGGLAIHGDYLYVGTGDTGANSNAEPDEMVVSNYYSTCLTNLNGKVLRINLDGSIPSDNPLVGQTVTACSGSPGTEPTMTSDSPSEEIFAWGFRNAYRLWADPLSGNLWVGHVGEVTYEMISVVPPEGNLHFGWPFREGNEGRDPTACEDIQPNVGQCTDSAYRCESSQGNPGTGDYNPEVPDQCDCVIGGLILTGCEWPDALEGHYVFGDYTNERMWTLQVNDARDNVVAERVDFGTTQGGGPSNFIEHEGALYISVYSANGHITRIAPIAPDAACDNQTPGTGGSGGGSGEGGAPVTGMAGAAQGGGNGLGGASNGGNAAMGGANNLGGGGQTPNPGGMPGAAGTSNPPTGDAGGGATPSDPNTPEPVTPAPTQPAPGSGGNNASPSPTAGPSDSGGAGGAVATNGTDEASDDGCGCRVAGREHSSTPLGLVVFGTLLGLAGLRRRRS